MAKRKREPLVPQQLEQAEPPAPELQAADRREQEYYPSNNFALSAAVLVVLIAVIVVLYVTGVIKP